MAANTSGNYGSNRRDFGVSNHREKLQTAAFGFLKNISVQFLTTPRIGVHWCVSRPDPGLLNAGLKGRSTASLPLQLSTWLTAFFHIP
jgi:hypothetical protein